MTDAGCPPVPSLAVRAHQLALLRPVADLADDSVTSTVGTIVDDLAPLADARERARLITHVVDRLRGLGPIEELLQTDGVSDVMINGPGAILVERKGRIEATGFTVDRLDIDHLIERMVAPLGRRLDRTSPLVDGRLPDGSRVHVAAAPVAVDGPYITIRRFRVRDVTLSEVAGPGVAALLEWAIGARCNIVVCGGTGSGKTTLLNALAAKVDPGERIVTIEDAAELRIPAPHVVRLEARPSMADGPPPIAIRELVRNALRMRPDRIVVGEVRGAETIDMLQAMNTGHEGSLTTVHANSPADALRRLEAMVLMDSALPQSLVREQIVQAVDLVVHMERVGRGGRQVAAVAEPVLDQPLDIVMMAGPTGLDALPTRPRRRAVAAPSVTWLGGDA